MFKNLVYSIIIMLFFSFQLTAGSIESVEIVKPEQRGLGLMIIEDE